MEIRCPSCGTTHQTEDYPDAFEIQCSCGYSILLPDEKTSQRANDTAANFDGIPVAMEVEDEEMRVSLEKELSQFEAKTPETSLPSFTPPEELPEGMVYDPFEVNQLEVPSDSTPMAGYETAEEQELNSNQDSFLDGFPNQEEVDQDSLEFPNNDYDSEEQEKTPEPEEEFVEQTSGQSLVDRTQLATVGQLIGPSYDLEWSDLNRLQLSEIKDRLKSFLKHWPWLKNELKKRHIELENLEDLEAIQNLPELIAVQLYILCFEFGGKCEFRLHQT